MKVLTYIALLGISANALTLEQLAQFSEGVLVGAL